MELRNTSRNFKQNCKHLNKKFNLFYKAKTNGHIMCNTLLNRYSKLNLLYLRADLCTIHSIYEKEREIEKKNHHVSYIH